MPVGFNCEIHDPQCVSELPVALGEARARSVGRAALRGARSAGRVVAIVAALGMHVSAQQTFKPIRSEVRADHGVVAAGRTFVADAGAQMLASGGNAIDAGVASIFASAVTEISHFGLGGEAPIIIYSASDRRVVVINGQGSGAQGSVAGPVRGEDSDSG